jgi:uncharacterized membrane protein
MLLLMGGTALIVVLAWAFWMGAKRGFSQLSGGAGKTATELDNNTVTVSKLQVALLSTARKIQSELSELSAQVDTSSIEGLQQLMQESVLALLRNPEYWSHVKTSSETVRSRDEAEALFNKLLISERSKFSSETLVNVGGKVRRGTVKVAEDEVAAYIVVTLLIGTAHDKPIFDQIHTIQDLQSALEKIAALPAEYLMVFELLWSPQESSDSLTYDELLTEYSDMLQL